SDLVEWTIARPRGLAICAGASPHVLALHPSDDLTGEATDSHKTADSGYWVFPACALLFCCASSRTLIFSRPMLLSFRNCSGVVADSNRVAISIAAFSASS